MPVEDLPLFYFETNSRKSRSLSITITVQLFSTEEVFTFDDANTIFERYCESGFSYCMLICIVIGDHNKGLASH